MKTAVNPFEYMERAIKSYLPDDAGFPIIASVAAMCNQAKAAIKIKRASDGSGSDSEASIELPTSVDVMAKKLVDMVISQNHDIITKVQQQVKSTSKELTKLALTATDRDTISFMFNRYIDSVKDAAKAGMFTFCCQHHSLHDHMHAMMCE